MSQPKFPCLQMIRIRTLVERLVATVGTTLLAIGSGWCQSPQVDSREVSSEISSEQVEFFETRIRPVLVEHCYRCHNSSDAAEGGLTLDDRQGLRDGGDGGPLIVIGDPDNSRLIAILKHEIDGLEMPEDGPKLDQRVIADFERWIANGAIDPRDAPPSSKELSDATSWDATARRRKQWWSFQPIVDPPVPVAVGIPLEANPIDHFIVDRLSREQQQPSAPASPSTLIRRLYLTLIGLPPTMDQWSEWLRRYEQSPQPSLVTEALVDHLLASDHFGERWARHWMDWIRYAESHGSEGDPAIDGAWIYRDYLIRALNADVPYDQLVREHLAGDLLDPPRENLELGINESIIGTAHWRMVFHGFAPTDALDEKIRFIDDQVNAFGKAFMGLTISCARCHDHKFDAISQRDYYAMFGVLASCRPGRIAIDLPQRQHHNGELLSELKLKIRQGLADHWLASLTPLSGKLQSGDTTEPSFESPESVFHPLWLLREKTESEFEQGWRALFDAAIGSDESKGDSAAEQAMIAQWDFSNPSDANDWNLAGIGLEDQPTEPGAFAIASQGDTALVGIYPAGIYSHLRSDKLPARLTSPDVQLAEESEVWLRVLGDGQSATRYAVQDYPRNGTVYPVAQLKPSWNWQRFDLSYWSGDSVHFEVSTAKDAPLLVMPSARSWFGITQVRVVKKGSSAPVSTTTYLLALADAASALGTPSTTNELIEIYQRAISDALKAWREGRTTNGQAELLAWCLQAGVLTNSIAQLDGVAPLIEAYRRAEAEIPVPSRVPALEETRGRTQQLYIRGNHRAAGEIVPRRFLEIFDGDDYGNDDSGRRELADDLLRGDNPFTRRVIVNRIWHHLFGRGIFATPDNLGRLGEQPSHPELLDWLACRLVDDGWSLKSLIRRIVTSTTWQQSSTPSSEAAEHDPANVTLSHANLRRLEAEAIRDSLLSVSGTLDRSLYGPPVDGASNRRSIYIRVVRNSLDPFLRSFDFPEPFSATGRRDVTNVPAQSLTLLNDPMVNRWANSLALSVINHPLDATDAPTTDASDRTSDAQPGIENEQSVIERARIQRLFGTLFSRPARDQEIRYALDYLATTRETFEQSNLARRRLEESIGETETAIASIWDTAQRRIESKDKNSDERAATSRLIPAPIARWDFEQDLADSVGGYDGLPHGDVRIEGGKLVLGRGAYVTTSPLKVSLFEKTIEAWVQLDDLDQRGGGVVTVQTPDGNVFDSIVFGEMEPRKWLAGSDFHRRSKSFSGSVEEEARERVVHLAITYHADGTIVGYRNGVRYGTAYQTSSPIQFQKDNAIVSLGLRHLPAGGNRLLRGRIELAAVYDQALTDEQIAASFQLSGGGVTREQLLEAMTPSEQTRLDALEADRSRLTEALQSSAPLREPLEPAVWTEMSRALMLLKELIYVP